MGAGSSTGDQAPILLRWHDAL
uniref:Uncharacterized protein n=1 Tax=Arundo donax TaxID=35708 RepID=A0A0A8YEG9_ARUDO